MAKAEGIAGEIPPDKLRPMLRQLLEDRFQLQVRREKKIVNHLALVVAKGGSKLQPNAGEPFDVRLERGPLATFTAMSMPLLASLLRPYLQTDRPVVDATRLKGLYNFQLHWAPARLQADAPPDNNPDPSMPAALREQLGLRLELRRSSIDVYIVERAERPAEN
jgi:uncharacterized protein (TIGR03435 family)